ncbi:MAG: metal ABC transporter substrate-binding protein [Gammaproteobacteria bacterium]
MAYTRTPANSIASIIILSIIAACGKAPDKSAVTARVSDSENLPIKVVTVNYPLAYFAERIGGEMIEAAYPGPQNIDPVYWQPDTSTILAYQKADLIVLNGAGYAGWTKQVSLPVNKQLDTSDAFTNLLIPITDNVVHTHGPGGEHVHDDLAATVWLDPELAKLQATSIHDTLITLLPDKAEIMDANLIALADDLWTLDEELARAFKYRNRDQVIYSHPVYQYLDRRYDLDGMTLHWEPDEIPSEEGFAKLADKQGAVMIWEAEPLPEMITRIEAMGISIAVFKTSATTPDSGDYLSVMQANLQRLKPALL